jgi:anti-sigma factor ChrR (cupin superfamily)
MKSCSHPMGPNDEELLRYVLDEEPLSPEASEHVTQCSICQNRVLHYQQVNRYLLKNLYRSVCPSPTMLNMYSAAALSYEDTQRVEEHVQICPLCAQEVREIRQILADFELFPELPTDNRSERIMPT